MTPVPSPSERDSFRIPPETRLGHVHLTVASLDRQTMFYTQVLGFTLHQRQGSEAILGSETEVLLRLTEDSAARRVQHSTGMYHFAILYPSRKELARAIARLFTLRYPNAPTDHGISKTTYLDDPEGNTIELYVRSLEDATYEFVGEQLIVRYADGHVGNGRDPLDLPALLGELNAGDPLDLPLPEGTRIGHVHLYASGLDSSLHFYSAVLGFEPGLVVRSFRMGDVGLDDQQPHVVAFNTWKGSDIPPAPAHALGMQYFTIVLPSAGDLQTVAARVREATFPAKKTTDGYLVRDPSQINVLLTDSMFPVPGR
jgi:catechol 2,3-dioxygenase